MKLKAVSYHKPYFQLYFSRPDESLSFFRDLNCRRGFFATVHSNIREKVQWIHYPLGSTESVQRIRAIFRGLHRVILTLLRILAVILIKKNIMRFANIPDI